MKEMLCKDCEKCVLDTETGEPFCTVKAEQTDLDNECDYEE